MRRLRGAHIGADRDHHADISRGGGGDGSDEKTHRRQQSEFIGPDPGAPQDNEQRGGYIRDGRVLPVEIRLCPFLDRLRNALHLVRSFGQFQNP